MNKVVSFLYKNQTIFTIFLTILIVNFFVIACQHKMTHQDRVDIISNSMHVLHTNYKDLLVSMNQAHASGILTGEKYKLAQNIALESAPIVFKLLDLWKDVPQTDADIQAFVVSKDFQSAVKLSLQLAEILNKNNIKLDLSKLLIENL